MLKKSITIKEILLTNDNWKNFFIKHKQNIRPSILIAIVKLLSCKSIIRGHRIYSCSNKKCSYSIKVHHTCKSKACSSCGKKATDIWIAKQNAILPQTEWQHITFTMPSQLWELFWLNRTLLNKIGLLSAECINTIAYKKNVIPCIFIAIHTFGRDLKRNVHIHLSTTRGGIAKDLTSWKSLFFRSDTLMSLWRYKVIKLFRNEFKKNQLKLPVNLNKKFNHTFTFNNMLDELYQKRWIVYCSKASSNHNRIVNYLGRYTKRPPIAQSKLKHFDGQSVVFKALDHVTKTYKDIQFSIENFIARFIQHIPDVGFRMIRYYGALANRVRGKLLPLVYILLGQIKRKANIIPTFPWLIKVNFGFDPLKCPICYKSLVVTHSTFGKTNNFVLLKNHYNLATKKFHK